MSEQVGPPTEGERIQRDMEWMRRTERRWRDGFAARMSEDQPEGPTGRKDQRASLAHLADERCPKREKVQFREVNPEGTPYGYTRSKDAAVPAHEQERWRAGYLHADALIVLHGRTRVSSDPTHVRHPKKEVAPTVEIFPDAVLTKHEVAARRMEKARKSAGTVDAGEQ